MAATRQGHGKRQWLEENDICRLSLGGEVVCPADQTVIVWCPRHLREQSPFFARAKKRKKIHWISWHCPFKLNFPVQTLKVLVQLSRHAWFELIIFLFFQKLMTACDEIRFQQRLFVGVLGGLKKDYRLVFCKHELKTDLIWWRSVAANDLCGSQWLKSCHWKRTSCGKLRYTKAECKEHSTLRPHTE